MVKTFAALLALLFSCAQAQTLEGRDINGDGSFDAYYDSAQNISWLSDANHFATQGNPIQNNPMSSIPMPLEPGQMSASTAGSWVANLSVLGVDDWRLPQRFVPAGGSDPSICGPTSCNPWYSWPSEMSFLAIALNGTPGPFTNMQNGLYMTSFASGGAGGAPVAELRNLLNGNAYPVLTDEYSLVYGYVLPVRDGDIGQATAVTPVPEPGTWALVTVGLIGLGTMRWRRRAGRAFEV